MTDLTGTNASRERLGLVMRMNNIAVSLLRLKRYLGAQRMLTSALKELKKSMSAVDDAPILAVPSAGEDNSTESILLDDWMVHSQNCVEYSEEEITFQASLFVYREGIVIPSSLLIDSSFEIAEMRTAVASAIIFNLGVTFHMRAHKLEDNEKLLKSADQLYRLALQYRKGKRNCQGRYLLAVCNNLAVLHRDCRGNGISVCNMDASTLSLPNEMFVHLIALLQRFRPSLDSAPEEAGLWHSYMENVRRFVMATSGKGDCAAAA